MTRRFKETISFANAKKSQICLYEKGEYIIIDTITCPHSPAPLSHAPLSHAPHYAVLSVVLNLGSCLHASNIFTGGHLQPKIHITDPDTSMTAKLYIMLADVYLIIF